MSFANPVVQQVGGKFVVSHGDDTSAFVEFEMMALDDDSATASEGKIQARIVPFATIRFPGDTTKVVVRPVDDEIKRRWPNQYAAFERNEKPSTTGFPVEQAPFLNRGDVKILKAANIFTLEQLASISDGNLPGGWRTYRDSAQAVLGTAEKTKDAQHIAAQLAELRADNESLRQQIAAISASHTSEKKKG